MNHARRLADGDWTGADSDGEEDMEKQDEGEREQYGNTEDEGMEVERRKLPKHYANQVSVLLPRYVILLTPCYPDAFFILASRGHVCFYDDSQISLLIKVFFLLSLCCQSGWWMYHQSWTLIG